jgi:hypothetical protein
MNGHDDLGDRIRRAFADEHFTVPVESILRRTHRRRWTRWWPDRPAVPLYVAMAMLLLLALFLAGISLREHQNKTLAPTPGISPTTSGRTAPGVPIFTVDADRKKGAHVHEMPRGSFVDQEFRATLPTLVQVAVVIGRDPRTAPPPIPDGGPIGPIRVQFLERGTVLVAKTVEARNNVETMVDLGPPLRVEVGRTYILRVTNIAPTVLGFYFNINPDPQNRTVLHGAVDPPGVAPHEHALSARILGRSTP